MNKYSLLSTDEMESHLSNFMVRKISYSSVLAFQRNEKAYERQYIFGEYTKRSSLASIVGTIYHKALEQFFSHYKETAEKLSFDVLLAFASDEIEMVAGFSWPVTDKNPTEKLKLEAHEKLNTLLSSFLKEVDSYLHRIKVILEVEYKGEEFVVLNGVDIPLPFKFKIDLLFINQEDRLCIMEHKSVHAYTDEKDVDMKYSQQSITYSIGIEAKIESGKFADLLRAYPKMIEGVQEFYFYENKGSMNRDGSSQIHAITVKMDADTRRLYEAILYEPVRRVIEAAQDPDYIYLLNPSDVMCDKAELMDFWIRTQIQEVDEFHSLDIKTKENLKKRKRKIRDSGLGTVSPKVIENFKNFTRQFLSYDNMENLTLEERIETRLKMFSVFARVEKKISGFSCDVYLLEVGAGTKISSIYSHNLDIANALGVANVRIGQELVQIERKSYLPIEVNKDRTETLLFEDKYLLHGTHKIPVGIGVFGEVIYWDLDSPSAPHMLVGGAAGSGKSNFIKSVIRSAQIIDKEIEIIMLDPKMEFSDFKGIRVIQEIEEIETFLSECVVEMNLRFRKERPLVKTLVIFDEFSDAMQMARSKKALEKTSGIPELLEELEEKELMVAHHRGRIGADKMVLQLVNQVETIKERIKLAEKSCKTLSENNLMLVQKGRSAGFNFLEATQRPSVKVITGDAKVNFNARLCFSVPSRVDSNVILDDIGAEYLTGKGDGLFRSPETRGLVRIQSFFTE